MSSVCISTHNLVCELVKRAAGLSWIVLKQENKENVYIYKWSVNANKFSATAVIPRSNLHILYDI